MANGNMNPVLLVHGWSGDFHTFEPMQEWLRRQGYLAEHVYFGQYDSMEDHVTFDDVAIGLQARFADLQSKGKIRLDPFSLDVIVHSTGGPAVRHWLHYYLTQIQNGDLSKCPIKRFIMLAPANFGSRLAQAGETALAKIFVGGISHGFATGKKILQGLELGSPILWGLAENDLFSQAKFYPVRPDSGPYVFVLSGTSTFGLLKGFVASGANEDGSDGTVRASAASLNSIKITSEFITDRSSSTTAILVQRNDPIAFRLVQGCNHSTIVSEKREVHPAVAPLILQCLKVNSMADYVQIREDFDKANAAFYSAQNSVHRYQQVFFHVQDQLGNGVEDYRMEFHVVDESIRASNWGPGGEGVLDQLSQYKTETNFLQDHVISNVQTHSVDSSYRTFFVNIDRLDELLDMMHKKNPACYIGMNLDAIGPTKNLTYDTDRIRYIKVSGPIGEVGDQPFLFFKENTTTLVEITLGNTPTEKVVNVWPSSEPPPEE
jgi:pimeloyl-ACP methyl ester carboxylesterase